LGFLLGWPWLWRNKQKFGHARLSTIQGYNLFYYHAALTASFLEGKSRPEVALRWEKELKLRDPKNPVEVDIDRQRFAVSYIRQHPFAYAWVHFRGTLAMFLGVGFKGTAKLLGLGHSAFNFLLEAGFALLQLIGYVAAFWGAFLLWRDRTKRPLLPPPDSLSRLGPIP